MSVRGALDPLASRGGSPVRESFLPLAVPSIGEREKQLVLETLDSGWITTGPKTHELGARVAAIGSRHGLPIVEDAAHALGACWKGRPVGSFSTVTAFSFYATKNLTTGEGGAAVTDDGELAERISLLSLHGMNRDAWKRYTDT